MAKQNIPRYPKHTEGHSERSTELPKTFQENHRLVQFSGCNAPGDTACRVCCARDIHCAWLQAEREEELHF